MTTTWPQTTLGAVCDRIIGGGTPSKQKEIYWHGNIPWASVKDFTDREYKLSGLFTDEAVVKLNDRLLVSK